MKSDTLMFWLDNEARRHMQRSKNMLGSDYDTGKIFSVAD